jgi:FG-GAP-like repeat/FG-GAP repeat
MCSKRLIHFGWILYLCLFVSNGWCATPIFQLLNTYSSGGIDASSVAVADVNGDGKPDIIVADWCASDSSCSDGGIVGVLLGNGDGTFQPVRTYKSGGLYATWVTAQDVNGDGKPDLIVVHRSIAPGGVGGVGILFGNGDGTFQPAVTFASGGSPSTSAAVADFNHDGIPDIAIANWEDQNWIYSGSISVLLGAGGGTFQAAQTYISGYWTNSVVAADVNGDGAADLLVGTEGDLSVLLGNGDGTFQPATPYRSGGIEGCWIAVADVNGDGKLDVLAANEFASSPNYGPANFGVLLGNGDGTFQPVTRYRTSSRGAGSIAIADLNRDNKLDILVADEHLNVFWGQGDGTFHHAHPPAFRVAQSRSQTWMETPARMSSRQLTTR